MSFLEPLLLLAMPLIGLPILIHLLNQRRHKTEPWAAREFVLQASNMGRGMAAIRHKIVLALRALAIAALIFAISRPLVSRVPGLGFLGSQRTHMVIVDRSPSMAIRDSANGLTWRETGLNQLEQHLLTVGGRQVLFHSLSNEPVAVRPGNLAEMLETSVTDTQTNIPELVERTLEYVQTQTVGPADIWVCTDRQSSDWRLDSGRWNRIREQLELFPDVKLHFLMPESTAEFNLAVSAENVKLVQEDNKYFLYFDFNVQQTSGQVQQRNILLQVQVAGGERNVEIEMVAGDFRYKQLRIEVPLEFAKGGGVIRLPHDSNESDNQFYFSYSPQPARNSVVVSDDQGVADLLKLVCSTPFEQQEAFDCNVLPVIGQTVIDWQNTALVVWHAALPTGTVADQLKQFVADGGNVVFLPVESIGTQNELFGVRWGDWEGEEKELAFGRTKRSESIQMKHSPPASGNSKYHVAQWRTQDDLLATDESGRELPLKSIGCYRRCAIESKSASVLASFEDGQPLLVRAATESGGVYFLGTTPDESNSTFTEDGIALYVMFQRALEQGSAALAGNRQLETGTNLPSNSHLWKPLEFNNNNNNNTAEDQRAFFAGVYNAGDEVIAINRPVSEDSSGRINEAAITELLGEDSFGLIQTSATSLSSLTNEIWKLFIIAMVIALIAEGWFSLPAKRKTVVATEAIG